MIVSKTVTRTRTSLLAAVSMVAFLAAACGGGGNDTAAPTDRTVRVEMVDIAFRPATIDVRRGETVRFVFDNNGKVTHDAFLGDAKAQADHAKDMRDMGGMSHGDRSKGISVRAGKSGELVHIFDEATTLEIGCHQPGHYEAGMRLTVNVT